VLNQRHSLVELHAPTAYVEDPKIRRSKGVLGESLEVCGDNPSTKNRSAGPRHRAVERPDDLEYKRQTIKSCLYFQIVGSL
jgi:hypothetical protein